MIGLEKNCTDVAQPHSHRHGDYMTESDQWVRFSENGIVFDHSKLELQKLVALWYWHQDIFFSFFRKQFSGRDSEETGQGKVGHRNIYI